MAKMTYKQIDHCNSRLQELYGAKVGKTPEKPEKQSVQVLYREIASGDRVIGSSTWKTACQKMVDTDNKYHYDLQDALIEVIYETDNKRALEQYTQEIATYKKLCERINNEVTRIRDVIILGDQHEAMALLSAFESWKP
jgi:hypothetical protein